MQQALGLDASSTTKKAPSSVTRCAQRVLEARPASAPVASAAVTCWCVGFFHRKYSPDCAKTLVVHVGKTAGGSAVEFLRGNGLLLFA